MNKQHDSSSVALRGLVAAIAFALSATAGAADGTTFSAYAGAGYSDNLGRAAVNEQGESIYATGIALDWERDGSRLDGKVAGGLDWYNYTGDLFDDELLGRLNGDLTFGLIPGRFDWALSDVYGQTATDPLQPVTAGNRQNVNVFSTGPDVTVRLGSATSLQLAGRYSDVRYSDSLEDYSGWSASAGVSREMSEVSAVSLTTTRQHVSYAESGLFPDYDRDQIYMGYETKGARTKLQAKAGWSRAERANDKQDAPLFELTVDRDLSARSTLSLQGLYGLSTGGEIFSQLQPGIGSGDGPNTDPTTSTGDYAEQTLFNAAWVVRWPRTTLSLGALYGNEDYRVANTQDVERLGGSFSLTREFTTKLSGDVFARYEQRDYTAADRQDDDTTYGFGLKQRIGRSLAAQFSITVYDRASDLSTGDYSETQTFLKLVWMPGERQTVSR